MASGAMAEKWGKTGGGPCFKTPAITPWIGDTFFWPQPDRVRDITRNITLWQFNIAMEHVFFSGKTHYFDWAMFKFANC